MSHNYISFEDVLDDDDFGFILDKDGHLKGVWIPSHLDDVVIPAAVVEIVKLFFKIDINDKNNYETLH